MKRIIVFTIFMLMAFSVKANDKEPILYIFPDSVEVRLYNYIDENIKNYPEGSAVALNLGIYKEKYRISVSFYSPDSNIPFWISRSNRFGVIGTRRYSLVLDYDHKFSTTKPDEIGTFGNREGQILKTMVINDGYSISWERIDGIVHVYESYGIMREKESEENDEAQSIQK